MAYATTIHKSQGTEYKLVIMPLVNAFSRMLQRNLLYTGLTRASESLVLLGQESAYQQAVLTTGVNRQTTLQARIMQYANQQVGSRENQQLVDESKNEADSLASQPLSHDDTDLPTATAAKDNYILTVDLINSNKISPNIGLDGLTPADFMSV
ncbi:ATP-dependent RecD-like DNA helicase [Weissella paramesenteroides]